MTATVPAPTASPTEAAIDSSACSADHPASGVIRDVLSRVGDKWSLLVIGLLGDRSLRFTELHRRIDGISHRMLTQTLRNLERDGLVSRTSYAEIPPRVEYAATPLGRSLAVPVLELVGWASAHHEQITAARDAYDETSAR
ncbi:helix-turn-helix transcriptional regulator [Agromyces sp. SYSU K20354]|uniref:winged helix-turn-helix transcriptional regulator n=1 Tax=Agromyces cavernae TaxID=2898659 RepID=UPI001E4E59F1|nr:helix-turn-helix domain-containing protein [Agromyces cavernae]MCD2443677.1 helix-turn-helix transcriptional regulator [Agromyces cavernae]